MRRESYITTEDYTYSVGPHDTRTLPKGSHILPMHLWWVPKHIKEHEYFRYTSDKTHTFVYSSHGIVPIPTEIIGTTY